MSIFLPERLFFILYTVNNLQLTGGILLPWFLVVTLYLLFYNLCFLVQILSLCYQLSQKKLFGPQISLQVEFGDSNNSYGDKVLQVTQRGSVGGFFGKLYTTQSKKHRNFILWERIGTCNSHAFFLVLVDVVNSIEETSFVTGLTIVTIFPP